MTHYTLKENLYKTRLAAAQAISSYTLIIMISLVMNRFYMKYIIRVQIK